MTVSEGASRGEIVDFVPVLYPPDNLKDLGRYVSVFVRLESGARTFGVLLGDPAGLEIGTRVVLARIDEERKVPFFQVAGQS